MLSLECSMIMLTGVDTSFRTGSFLNPYFVERARARHPVERFLPGRQTYDNIHQTFNSFRVYLANIQYEIFTRTKLSRTSTEVMCKEFGVWCVVGSPVWKPRDMMSEGVPGGAGAPSAPTTLPRSQRPAPRAHHLSASRKSLAPDHRH